MEDHSLSAPAAAPLAHLPSLKLAAARGEGRARTKRQWDCKEKKRRP